MEMKKTNLNKKNTDLLPQQFQTSDLNQFVFTTLCKMNVHVGEALLLTCVSVDELLNRPWISANSKLHFQHAHEAKLQHSAAGDRLDKKLNQLIEELAYFCFINALKQDVFNEYARVLKETKCC
jgi:hypothetical protein